MTKTIVLTKGFLTIVDDEDYERLSRYSWHAKKNHNKYYAQRRSGLNHYQMHNVIMEPPPGFTIDHINGNSLDNRKCNLRFATQKEQCFNRSKIKGKSSIYKGVSFHKGKQKWCAQIKTNGVTYCLGTFLEQEDAAFAYDKKALQLFGEYAQLNFSIEQLLAWEKEIREQMKAMRMAAEKRWGRYSPEKQISLF